MSRCLQQEMSTLILRWDVCKTVLSMWVGACNRVCLYWFWDGTFPRQFTLYKYIGICNWVRLHWFRDGTFTRQLDLYEASATWNVYTDSKMGCLQDSLICLSSMRGNCNQKCLHQFWDGMFTRQFGPYERHLQQEMSTSILRWDVYKTLWSVQEASATGNVSIDSDMGRLQDSLICISVWEASAPGNVYIDSKMGCLQDSLICTRGICNRKCLHQFRDGTFTRQFDLYERHLQLEPAQSLSGVVSSW